MAPPKFLVHLFKMYDNQIRVKNPIKAKMATAFLLFSMGDMTCQILEKRQEWDYMRSLRMASVAGLFLNPISQVYFHYFVPCIDVRRRFPTAKGHLLNSLLRGLAHFLIMGTFANASQLYLPAYLKNFNAEEGHLNLTTKFGTSFKVGGLFWPPIHFFNYQFVPVHFRQLFVDVNAFLYAIFLSYLSNKQIERSGAPNNS